MRLLFMGSGSFAVPSLNALMASPAHDVCALISQPDKPAGRGHRLRLPATKQALAEHDIPVHQPVKVRTPESVDLIRDLAPECIVVVAYGQIIPKTILDLPPRGIINVHASLLPAYRGAAPIQWAVARGETETGVTTMLIDEGLDTGPILLQGTAEIESDDTSATLTPKLAELGAPLLLRTLETWENGTLEPTPQDETRATLAPLIKKLDGIIDWTLPAEQIANRVRAFNPWPVAQTTLGDAPLKVWKAHARTSPSTPCAAPGSVIEVDSAGFSVTCGHGVLAVDEVQPSGKGRMAAADFARGRRLTPGTLLGVVGG
jgi:methionyl-tRNA formyltransferase